jgi:transcriptional regulator with XRE-family HTH domain
MMNETIREGLRPYAVGEKVRILRLRKSMGLVQLGKHTGLSPATLSKLERGKLLATLPTLLRIAMVFGVGLDHFFTDERKRHLVAVVRSKERMRFEERMGGQDVVYRFESLDFRANNRKLSSFYAECPAPPKGKPRTHHHPGVELLLVLQGSLCVTIGPDEHQLEEGDAIYFDSSVRHGYRRAGRGLCSAMVVTAE